MGERSHPLGHAPGDEKPTGVSNHRKGTSGKTVLTRRRTRADRGAIERARSSRNCLDVPNRESNRVSGGGCPALS